MFNGSIRLGSILGVQINVHLSWFLTIFFITTVLALRVYPDVFPARSPNRDDAVLHWAMAAASCSSRRSSRTS